MLMRVVWIVILILIRRQLILLILLIMLILLILLILRPVLMSAVVGMRRVVEYLALRSIFYQHLLLREAVQLAPKIVQVEAVRVQTRLAPQKSIAVLRRPETRADCLGVHHHPIHLCYTFKSVVVLLERHVRAAGRAVLDGTVSSIPVR